MWQGCCNGETLGVSGSLMKGWIAWGLQVCVHQKLDLSPPNMHVHVDVFHVSVGVGFRFGCILFLGRFFRWLYIRNVRRLSQSSKAFDFSKHCFEILHIPLCVDRHIDLLDGTFRLKICKNWRKLRQTKTRKCLPVIWWQIVALKNEALSFGGRQNDKRHDGESRRKFRRFTSKSGWSPTSCICGEWIHILVHA